MSSSQWFIDGKATTRWAVCVRSPNFPNRYEGNDRCTIDVLPGAVDHTVSSRAFVTEYSFDALTIDGQRYSGYSGDSGPDHVPVTPRSTIEWSTDGSFARSSNGVSGFELCLDIER
jgi:hypothetical protein